MHLQISHVIFKNKAIWFHMSMIMKGEDRYLCFPFPRKHGSQTSNLCHVPSSHTTHRRESTTSSSSPPGQKISDQLRCSQNIALQTPPTSDGTCACLKVGRQTQIRYKCVKTSCDAVKTNLRIRNPVFYQNQFKVCFMKRNYKHTSLWNMTT